MAQLTGRAIWDVQENVYVCTALNIYPESEKSANNANGTFVRTYRRKNAEGKYEEKTDTVKRYFMTSYDAKIRPDQLTLIVSEMIKIRD